MPQIVEDFVQELEEEARRAGPAAIARAEGLKSLYALATDLIILPEGYVGVRKQLRREEGPGPHRARRARPAGIPHVLWPAVRRGRAAREGPRRSGLDMEQYVTHLYQRSFEVRENGPGFDAPEKDPKERAP